MYFLNFSFCNCFKLLWKQPRAPRCPASAHGGLAPLSAPADPSRRAGESCSRTRATAGVPRLPCSSEWWQVCAVSLHSELGHSQGKLLSFQTRASLAPAMAPALGDWSWHFPTFCCVTSWSRAWWQPPLDPQAPASMVPTAQKCQGQRDGSSWSVPSPPGAIVTKQHGRVTSGAEIGPRSGCRCSGWCTSGGPTPGEHAL